MPDSTGQQPIVPLHWEPAWAVLAASGLVELEQGLPGRLGGALQRLGNRLAPEGWAAYFTDARAQPILQLPVWCAALVSETGRALERPAVERAVLSAACGYLQVRLQDDWLDEAIGDPGEVMLLSAALACEHQALLAEICPPEPFWGLFRARWWRHGEAMMLESEARDAAAMDESCFRRTLQRADPLLLPGAALLYRGQRGDLVQPVADWVDATVFAHQLFHDLLDARRDVAAGRTTWVTSRFGLAGLEPAGVQRRLLVEGGFDRGVEEALAALAEAENVADRCGLLPAGAWCRERGAWMEGTRQRLFKQFFAALLAPATAGKYSNIP